MPKGRWIDVVNNDFRKVLENGRQKVRTNMDCGES
jgi:hypothetical protein